jgi:hypothetical protein
MNLRITRVASYYHQFCDIWRSPARIVRRYSQHQRKRKGCTLLCAVLCASRLTTDVAKN